MYDIKKIKRAKIKNRIYIIVIILIALVSTYYIYNYFEVERSHEYSSDSLEITYHEPTGESIDLDKVTPVTDSVGLSSKAYTFSVRNNLTTNVYYKITLEDDIKKIMEDNCQEELMTKDMIKVSIRENDNDTMIYTLEELTEGVVLETSNKPLEEKEFSIRVWNPTKNEEGSGRDLHYHANIKIEETDKPLVNEVE